MAVSVSSSVNIGFMLALVIGGLLVNPDDQADDDRLIWIISIFAGPQVVFLAMSFCCLAESPLWLARYGGQETARLKVEKEILYLRGPSYPLDMEVQEIFNCTDKISRSNSRSTSKAQVLQDTARYFGKGRILKPLILMMIYMILQSLSGLETVSYYCLMLFRER